MAQHLRDFLRDASGATVIEWGLMAALVAVAAITALQALGTSIDELFTDTSAKVGAAISGS